MPISAAPELHCTPESDATAAAVQSIAKSDVPAVFGKSSEPLVFGWLSEPDANSLARVERVGRGDLRAGVSGRRRRPGSWSGSGSGRPAAPRCTSRRASSHRCRGWQHWTSCTARPRRPSSCRRRSASRGWRPRRARGTARRRVVVEVLEQPARVRAAVARDHDGVLGVVRELRDRASQPREGGRARPVRPGADDRGVRRGRLLKEQRGLAVRHVGRARRGRRRTRPKRRWR